MCYLLTQNVSSALFHFSSYELLYSW